MYTYRYNDIWICMTLPWQNEWAPGEAAVELMHRIEKVVPVLSGPLVARTVLMSEGATKDEIAARITDALITLRTKSMPLPRRDAPALLEDTLNRMARRGLVTLDGDLVRVPTESEGVLRYYANSIAHHFDA